MPQLAELSTDQNIFSIRKNGEVLGYISSKEGKFVTEGVIGENEYSTLTELIQSLYGFGIEIDNFYT